MLEEAARTCAWLELAALPIVVQNVQHRPDCHHWVAPPQYLKRHVKSQHPHLAELTDDCTEFVKQCKVGSTSEDLSGSAGITIQRMVEDWSKQAETLFFKPRDFVLIQGAEP